MNVCNSIKISSEQKRAFVCVLANLFVVLLIIFVGVNDLTNDDFFIQQSFLDSNGTPMQYHHIVNIIWTLVVGFLQKKVPSIAWHFFLQVILILISVNIINNEILNIIPEFLSPMLVFLNTYFLYLSTIQKLNFTKTSALLMGSGLILIFINKKTKFSIKKVIFGGLLILLGCQLRFETVCLLAIPICLICVVVLIKKIDDRYKMIISLIMILSISVGLQMGGMAVKKENTQWRTFINQFEIVQQLVDYPLDNYDEAKEEYLQLGMSENDVSMILIKVGSDYSFFDYNKLSLLKEKVSHKLDIRYCLSNNINIAFVRCVEAALKDWMQFFVWGILFFSLFCFRAKDRWIPLCAIGGVIAYLCFFAVMGRVAQWVIDGVFILAALEMLICYYFVYPSHNSKFFIGKRELMAIWILFIALYLLPLVHINSLKNRRSVTIPKDVVELSQIVGQDREHLYAYSYGLNAQFKAIENLLLSDDYFYSGNEYYLNLSEIAPFNSQKLENYEIENVYKDSINSEIIRFVVSDNDAKRIEKYIQEHYYDAAKMEIIDNIAGYNIYWVTN